MSDQPDENRTDRDLVGEVRLRGDEAAFRVLYSRHAPAVHGLLLRFLGGREQEAEDLLQEVWIRAVEKLPSFA